MGKNLLIRFDAAIQKEAEAFGADKPGIGEFKAEPGFGLQGKVGDERQLMLLGNERLMEAHQVPVSAEVRQKMEQLQNERKTAMLLALDKEIIGAIAVADTLRENSKRVVAELRKSGIELL